MAWLFFGAVLGVIGTLGVLAAVGAVQRLRERSRSRSVTSAQVPVIEGGAGVEVATEVASVNADSIPGGSKGSSST